MSRHTFELSARQFSSDCSRGFWTWIPISEAIIETAEKSFITLPANIFLRSSDCVHLATAAHNGFSEIYTFDEQQKTAAATFGLNVGQF